MNVYILIKIATDKHDGEVEKTNSCAFNSQKEVEIACCKLNTLLKEYKSLGSSLYTMCPQEVFDYSFTDEGKLYHKQKKEIVEKIRLIDKNFTDYYCEYEYTFQTVPILNYIEKD